MVRDGARQCEKRKLTVTAMYKTKTHTCTEVSLCGGMFFFYIQRNHELLLGTG